MTIAVKDATGTTVSIKTADDIIAALAGTLAVAATSLPLPTGAATDSKAEAIRALLAGTLAISAAALPLPAGAATDTKAEAIRALLAGTIAVSAAALPLPAGAATAAKQDAVTTAVQALAASNNYALASPSDTAILPATTRAITIGGAGNLTVKRVDGTTVGPIPVVAGQTLAIGASYIMATGTTATGILVQF